MQEGADRHMRFKDVFSIIGPSMIGPSSSHTAGAARLGRAARKLFGALPEEVLITFYGSFAETYRGHGTDVAIVGGILDYETDDPRIPDSLKTAQALGIPVRFTVSKEHQPHPNTAKMVLRGDGREVTVVGASIGGGNIEIGHVDSFDVRFSGMYPTLVITHADRTGFIADAARVLAQNEVNIGYMVVDRKGRNEEAMTVLEIDNSPSGEVLNELSGLRGVREVRLIDMTGSGNT
jgi:L-serine dehydratase